MASERVLTDALRIRLIMDGPNRLTLTSWLSTQWTSHAFGFFYANEETLDASIFQTITEVLAAENKTISTGVANTLRNSVQLTHKPLDAVKAMVIANDAAQ